MIIGGAYLYDYFLPQADRLYLSFIDAEIPGDTYFPALAMAEWQEVWSESHPADERHPYAYRSVILARRPAEVRRT